MLFGKNEVYCLSTFLICYFLSTFATAPSRSGVFKEKTMKQAWASDKGAWPVMGTFAVMISFVAGYGMYYMYSSPDVRILSNARKSFLRGELAVFSKSQPR